MVDEKEKDKMERDCGNHGCACGSEDKEEECGCGCGEECGCGCDCEDDEDDTITLTDDDGKDVDFYQVATLDYKEKWYTFLEPVVPLEGMEEGDLVAFELGIDENEEDVFLPVTDEKLLEEIFAEFDKMLEEEDDANK